MLEKLITMIESASVMLLPVLLLAAIWRRLDDRPLARDLSLGVVFAVIGAIVMNNSVELLPGIRTDPRGAVIVLALLFGGPVGGTVTIAALIAMRVWQGGAGVYPGIVYMVALFAVTLAFVVWRLWRSRGEPRLRTVVAGAALAAIVPPAILVFVSKLPWPVFLTAQGLAAPTNFLAVILVGALLVRDRERSTAIRHQLDQRAQINAIAGNAPAVIFQVRADCAGVPRTTYVSPAARRILGHDAQHLAAAHPPLADLLAPEDAATLEDHLDAAARGGESWSLDLPYRHPSGPRWLQISAGTRLDEEDRQVWDGTIIDITAQRAAEEMKDNFISVISHELRTPLTSIRGALGLALSGQGDPLPPQKEKMLQIANRNAARLVRLVNEILDSQKIRAGEMTFDIEVQPLRPIVLAAISAIEDYAPEKNLRIVFANHAGDARAAIDSHRLSLVLQNLLSNAAKFAPSDSEVAVESAIEDGMLRISVSDSGPGIPEEFRDHVFDRFRQAQVAHNRSTGGTGLGLNIARTFVTAMEGRIWFDTEIGVGTTFHIAFPLAEGAEAAAVEPGTAEATGEVAYRSDELPLLLYVEDDASLQQVVRERAEGRARIVSATTLAQARAIHSRTPADIVLLDLDLPDGAGTRLIEDLAESVPVVVFTAFELDPAVERRIARVLVKSRVPEEEVIEEVLRLLPDRGVPTDRDAA